MRSIRSWPALILLFGVAACDPDQVGVDAGQEPGDAAAPDAAGPDAASPDATGPDAAGPDAAGPDASLADAALVDATAGDASPVDAGVVDAAGPDAAPAPATLRVFDAYGVPRAGAFVVRQRGDVVVDVARTDSAGELTLVVASGDSVTAGYEDPRPSGGMLHRLVTWQGVEPGDVLSDGELAPSEAVLGTMQVVTPGPQEGDDYYMAWGGCENELASSATSPIEYPLHVHCHDDPAHIPVILYWKTHYDDVLAYATGEAPVIDGVALVNLLTWHAVSDCIHLTVGFTNLPQPNGNWHSEMELVGTGGEVFRSIARPIVPLSNQGEITAPYGLGASWFYADGSYEQLPLGTVTRERILTGPMPPPTSMSFDFSEALPRISSITVTGSDPSRATIGWLLDGPGDAVDTTIAFASFLSEDGATEWSFVAGPGTTSIQLPPLPDAMATFRPSALPTWYMDVQIVSDDDADGATAYRGFRAVLASAMPYIHDIRHRVTRGGARNVRLSQYRLDVAPH